LLYKLHKLKLSANVIRLIISCLSKRKFTVSVEGEISRLEKHRQWCFKVLSVPSIVQYVHNCYSQRAGVYPTLFAADIRIYSTDRKVGNVRRKLQRVITSIETWR
jgi:hypothetical protein